MPQSEMHSALCVINRKSLMMNCKVIGSWESFFCGNVLSLSFEPCTLYPALRTLLQANSKGCPAVAAFDLDRAA